ncbi:MULTISPECIES: hypothetical protein [Serratia]|uniref:hypothetical protein n=1 Tax=Serratia TaxID=613 RepID=UPI000F7F4671|nr:MULTISPECIES: hypothetical protein [Serratia]MBJ2097239.1 hypothetical protein [Serratia ureilytica]MBY4851522.1 hypothetical protein [Serratia marcescens]MCC3252203.1 hypothetical protein [Serratia marcescens]MCH9864533.1 hypothetical protein [Serratia marcescens]QSO58315.1 hypothetical protein J0F99_03075 [Serratia marcescens subsp. marcescens ATCC 13880]
MGMVNVAFWSNVALILALLLLVMVGIWNACRAARKNRVIMKHGKETRALIVNATPHKRQVVVGKVSVKLQLTYTVDRVGYYVLKDVIVSPYYVNAFKAGEEVLIRYSERCSGDIIIVGEVDN